LSTPAILKKAHIERYEPFAICSLEKISGFPHHKNTRVESLNLLTSAILNKAHIERYEPF
ncbi:hypothetical protein, partial [Aliivibrio logei]|uniref:hypothetical protein n=1 Tax=Aliivibrio logei TaxID=688 RepID=UPI001A7E1225